MKFTKTHEAANRGVSSYQSPEADGTIYLSKGAFGGNHPDSIEVADVPARTEKKAPKTEEEKKAAVEAEKARVKALTPAQRAQEKLDRAAKNLEAAQARAKKIADKEAADKAGEQPAA